MTKIFLTIIIIIFSVLTLQSQTKDTVYIVEKDTIFIAEPESKIEPVKYELGLLLGYPGRYNIAAIAHSENFLYKLSGGYFGYPAGGQVEVGYKIDELNKIYYGISAGVGFYSIAPVAKQLGLDNLREYFSINSIISIYGFFVSPGLSVYLDNLNFPQLILQVGYAYQFR